MAERVTVQLLDDIDGSEAAETFRFTWDGRALRLDLSTKNADKLKKALDPYLNAAQPDQEAPAPTAAPKRRGAPKGSSGLPTSVIRSWARENNVTVPDRGRLKPEVVSAWEAAGKPGA